MTSDYCPIHRALVSSSSATSLNATFHKPLLYCLTLRYLTHHASSGHHLSHVECMVMYSQHAHLHKTLMQTLIMLNLNGVGKGENSEHTCIAKIQQ